MITEESPFPCIDLLNKIPGYVNKFLPATMSVSIVPVISKMKIPGNEAGLKPFFNLPVKQIAARLSEIEMAFDCNDVSGLQFPIHSLKNLFLDTGMPAVYRLAGQMEELARENKFEEVRNLLRALKKIIGRVVKHRMHPAD